MRIVSFIVIISGVTSWIARVIHPTVIIIVASVSALRHVLRFVEFVIIIARITARILRVIHSSVAIVVLSVAAFRLIFRLVEFVVVLGAFAAGIVIVALSIIVVIPAILTLRFGVAFVVVCLAGATEILWEICGTVTVVVLSIHTGARYIRVLCAEVTVPGHMCSRDDTREQGGHQKAEEGKAAERHRRDDAVNLVRTSVRNNCELLDNIHCRSIREVLRLVGATELDADAGVLRPSARAVAFAGENDELRFQALR